MATLQRIKFGLLLSIILLIGFAFALSMQFTIQSFVGFEDNLIDLLKSYIYDKPQSILGLVLQLMSIILFSSSAFLLYIALSSSLSIMFLSKTDGIKRVIKWQLYKYLRAFLPIIVISAISILIFTASIIFFNDILALLGLDIVTISFISAFISLNLFLLIGIGIVIALYQLIKLNFGTELASVKAELDNQAIENQAKSYPVNFLIPFAYLFFIVLLGFQLKNIDNSYTLSLICLNLIGYAGLKYIKTSAYIKSSV